MSVLFADLVGFTALSEGRDPEATRELLTGYFELARETVERYGGTIEKFIGDAVMAVWGAPVAREDDAERAVRAALDLVCCIGSLDPRLQARAAVLTGEAVVTVGAAGQGMVAGDLVNTASRLQSVAQPGAVLVGEATERAAGRAIAFEPAGEHVLKGKSEPVSAWRAVRVVGGRAGRGRSEVLEPPFVGRDDELLLLKDLFHATGRERRTRLLSITGQAGIGKSRLAWEFLKYVDGLMEAAWWHEGRCPAYGDGVTFWALGEMVRRRAGLAEGDDERTTRERVAATVAEHVPDEQERRWIERALLVLLGLEPSPPGGSQELFAAWRIFFERLAGTGTCVLVFEDLQWADTGLLDFIDHLVEWTRGLPILGVTLARPELFERRPGWGVEKRSFVSMALEPLADGAMRQLLAGLVTDPPERAVRAIVERAGGIPLYAVETVRMLAEQGRLVPDAAGRYRPSGQLDAIAVPETLHELVASRLDTLDPTARSILQDAALLGQSFTLAGLAALAGVSEVDLEPHLRGLVRRELLTLNPDPLSPERGRYVFVQALVREVAYGMLARPERKARHLAAARWLQSTADEELSSAVAAHFLAAYRNAAEGAEADALAAQARVSLRAAATRALALGSPGQALTFLEQALDITTEPAEQADLLERAGEAASMATRHEEAEAHLRRAVEIRRSLGDRSGAARAIAGLAAALVGPLRYDLAIAVLEPAATEFADLVDDPAVIALESQLARVRFLHGEPLPAVEISDRLLGRAERLDRVDVVADTLITRGSALCLIGRTYEGIGATRTGIELADEAGLSETALRGRANLGSTLFVSDVRAAFRASAAALEGALRIGSLSTLTVALDNAVDAAIETGDWDWALEHCRGTLPDDVGPLERAVAKWRELEIRGLRGEDIAAGSEELIPIIRQTDPALFEGQVLRIRSTVLLTEHRMREAREALMTHARLQPIEAGMLYPEAGLCALWERDLEGAREALAGLEASGFHGRVVSAGGGTIRSGIAALEGRTQEARAGFRDVMAEWRDLGLPWRLALTAIVMATVLDPAAPEVAAAAGEAREILSRLGARRFQDHLEGLLRTPDEPPAAPPASAALATPA